jgi:hypothetical protein
MQSLLQYDGPNNTVWHARLKGCSFTGHGFTLESAIDLAYTARTFSMDRVEQMPNMDLFQ